MNAQIKIANQLETKRQNRVWGRLKNVEVGSALFTFELRRAGLVVRRKNHRLKDALLVPFTRLTNGGGFERGGVVFTACEAGVELRQGKRRKLLPWELLARYAADQPLLFAEAGA